PGIVVPLAAAEALVARTGIVGRLLRTAPTLRDALAIYGRYGRLSDGAASLIAEDEDGEDGEDGDLRVVLRHRPEVHALGLPIELMLAMGYRLLATAAGPLRRVTFAHPAFYPVAAYERFFGAPVVFRAAVDA